MSSAPVLTQCLSYLTMPIISRIFSPSMFGVFNLYTSIVDPLGSISTLGYHQAIILPKQEKDADRLFFLSILLGLILCFLLIAVLFILKFFQIKIANFDSIQPFLWLIPISVFLHTLSVILSSWNQRHAHFIFIAISKILSTLVNKVSLLIFGFIGMASGEFLIIGLLLGSITLVLIQGFNFLRKAYFSFTNIKVLYLKNLLSKYKNFPLYVMTSDLLFRITNSLVIIFMVYFFSDEIAGLYGMALMIAGVPSILIGSAIGEVFYQRASIEKKNKDNNHAYLKLFNVLTTISILSFSFLSIISEEVFEFLLGESWLIAGQYAKILCFSNGLSFIFFPFSSSLFRVYDKQQNMFISQCLLIIFSLASIVFGGVYKNINLFLILFSLSNGIIIFIYGIKSLKLVGILSKHLLAIMLKKIVFASPFIFSLIIIKRYLDLHVITLLILCIFLFILYLIFQLIIDKTLQDLFKDYKTRS